MNKKSSAMLLVLTLGLPLQAAQCLQNDSFDDWERVVYSDRDVSSSSASSSASSSSSSCHSGAGTLPSSALAAFRLIWARSNSSSSSATNSSVALSQSVSTSSSSSMSQQDKDMKYAFSEQDTKRQWELVVTIPAMLDGYYPPYGRCDAECTVSNKTSSKTSSGEYYFSCIGYFDLKRYSAAATIFKVGRKNKIYYTTRQDKIVYQYVSFLPDVSGIAFTYETRDSGEAETRIAGIDNPSHMSGVRFKHVLCRPAYLPDNKHMIVARRDGINVINYLTGKTAQVIKVPDYQGQNRVNDCFALHPEGDKLVLVRGNEMHLYEASKEQAGDAPMFCYVKTVKLHYEFGSGRSYHRFSASWIKPNIVRVRSAFDDEEFYDFGRDRHFKDAVLQDPEYQGVIEKLRQSEQEAEALSSELEGTALNVSPDGERLFITCGHALLVYRNRGNK